MKLRNESRVVTWLLLCSLLPSSSSSCRQVRLPSLARLVPCSFLSKLMSTLCSWNCSKLYVQFIPLVLVYRASFKAPYICWYITNTPVNLCYSSLELCKKNDVMQKDLLSHSYIGELFFGAAQSFQEPNQDVCDTVLGKTGVPFDGCCVFPL